jgi:cobalt-zinc-cadmium efflux system membrane fusion protein
MRHQPSPRWRSLSPILLLPAVSLAQRPLSRDEIGERFLSNNPSLPPGALFILRDAFVRILRRRRTLLLLASAIAAALACGCSRTTSANNNPPRTKVESAPPPDVFSTKHPERFALVKVESRSLPDRLLTTCAVSPDVQRTVHVTSLSAGRVIDVRARLGDQVAKGQVLLVLHSPELAAATTDYRKAEADEALTQKALERAQLLYSHGAVPQKDVEQAVGAQTKAKADVAAAVDRIRLLGGDLDRLSPVIEVKAPVAGTIVEQNTAGGEGVKSLDNSPSLFTIADLSRVWVLCDLYENDLAQVRIGDSAEVRLNAYPDRPLRGALDNISHLLDPATRSAKARLEMDNGLGLMRPGMFATAEFASRIPRGRMIVPAAAVLRLHDRFWVFRAEGEGRFRRTEVQTGSGAGPGWQEILAGGIRPGDAVAANALELSNSIEQM